MPYVNPYSTALPDVSEARLLALQAMIVASLADLNAALSRDANSPMTLTSAQVILGDPDTLSTSLICVVGGGKQDGTDMEIGQGGHEFMPRTDSAAPHLDVHTNIYVYLHSDDMLPDPTGDAVADALKSVQYREIARSRIVGHLRKRVFNSQQAGVIQLASQEFNAGGVFDQLLNARLTSVKMGVVPKNAGAFQYVYSAHLVHEGYVQ